MNKVIDELYDGENLDWILKLGQLGGGDFSNSFTEWKSGSGWRLMAFSDSIIPTSINWSDKVGVQ